MLSAVQQKLFFAEVQPQPPPAISLLHQCYAWVHFLTMNLDPPAETQHLLLVRNMYNPKLFFFYLSLSQISPSKHGVRQFPNRNIILGCILELAHSDVQGNLSLSHTHTLSTKIHLFKCLSVLSSGESTMRDNVSAFGNNTPSLV